MSKPRIYGTCPAGCLWETVHRDEFLRSASIVKLYADGNDDFWVELGKTYKIKRESLKLEWGFQILLNVHYDTMESGAITHRTARVTLDLPDPKTFYDEYLKIKIIAAHGVQAQDGMYQIYIVAECNGEVAEIETEYGSYSYGAIYLSADDADICVSGATECYLVNDDATVEARDGVGIASIVKTSTEGLVDTYTVTKEDGSTATFTVTNGAKGEKGETGGLDNITHIYGESEDYVMSQKATSLALNEKLATMLGGKEQAKLEYSSEVYGYTFTLPYGAYLIDGRLPNGKIGFEDAEDFKNGKKIVVEDPGTSTTKLYYSISNGEFVATRYDVSPNPSDYILVLVFHQSYAQSSYAVPTLYCSIPVDIYIDGELYISDTDKEQNAQLVKHDAQLVKHEEQLASLKEQSRNCLHLGGFVRGTATASDKYTGGTSNRITMADVVALPYKGATIKFVIPEDHAVGVRHGNQAENLNNNEYWFYNGDTFTFPETSLYYRITFCTAYGDRVNEDGSLPDYGGETTITPEEINAHVAAGEIRVDLDTNYGDTVISRNYHNEPYIRKQMSARKGEIANVPKQCVICHTTDLHGDVTRAKNFFEYAKYIKADMNLLTGDHVAYDKRSGQNYLVDLVNAHNAPSYVCTGNHDVYYTQSDNEVYQYCVEPYVSQGGYVDNGNPYYYADNTDWKLRVIALNLFDGGMPTPTTNCVISQAQIDWFIDTLKGTPAGYGVIVIMHEPSQRYDKITPVNDKFYSSVFPFWEAHPGISGQPIVDIIDAFISGTKLTTAFTNSKDGTNVGIVADFTALNANVEFIAHVVGHTHLDVIGYYTATNKQVMLGSVCGTGVIGTSYPYLANGNDVPRGWEGVTQDAFNIYVIDRTNKKIKIARVGSNMNFEGQMRDFTEISYK